MHRLTGCIGFMGLMTSLMAGGWPQEKGHAYLKLYEWWVVADQHYTDAGEIDPNVTNGIFNTIFYGEYGITDRLTAVASIPLFSRAYFNNTISGTTGDIITPGEAVNSIGDADIGLKYGMRVGDVAMSATLMLGLPLGNDMGGPSGILQTGDGEFNQLLRIDAGLSFTLGEMPGYMNVYAGFNRRSKGYSDDWRAGLEVGLNMLDKKLWLTGRLYTVQSTYNGETAATIISTSIFANNAEHVTISPEIAYYITPQFGVGASAGWALAGKIIFARPSYSVGVFAKL